MSEDISQYRERLTLVDPESGDLLDDQAVPDLYIGQVAISPDGTEVLFIGSEHTSGQGGPRALHRWTVGTDEITPVAGGITAVTW